VVVWVKPSSGHQQDEQEALGGVLRVEEPYQVGGSVCYLLLAHQCAGIRLYKAGVTGRSVSVTAAAEGMQQDVCCSSQRARVCISTLTVSQTYCEALTVLTGLAGTPWQKQSSRHSTQAAHVQLTYSQLRGCHYR
jgi:hypothetical protein